ncbi:hypothetical protein [Paenibacillus uliginis]|nr:hypothetical protein [Paenibacillus uliginis]
MYKKADRQNVITNRCGVHFAIRNVQAAVAFYGAKLSPSNRL